MSEAAEPAEHLRGGFRIGGPEGVWVATRALMAPMVGYNEAPLRTEMTYKHGSVPDSVGGDQPTPTPTGT